MMWFVASLNCVVVVAEWLRRWTRNLLWSPCTGSNPVNYVYVFLVLLQQYHTCTYKVLRNLLVHTGTYESGI